jgi:hypothetical protein
LAVFRRDDFHFVRGVSGGVVCDEEQTHFGGRIDYFVVVSDFVVVSGGTGIFGMELKKQNSYCPVFLQPIDHFIPDNRFSLTTFLFLLSLLLFSLFCFPLYSCLHTSDHVKTILIFCLFTKFLIKFKIDRCLSYFILAIPNESRTQKSTVSRF